VEHLRARLKQRLQQYAKAESDAELRLAILGLHQVLQEAFHAYLKQCGVQDVDDRAPFPTLVDAVRDRTPLLAGDQKTVVLLQSLTNTRNDIAHDRTGELTPDRVANDADQLARLIVRFWQTWYAEPCPVRVVGVHSTTKAPPASQPRSTPQREASRPEPQPRPTSQRSTTSQAPTFRPISRYSTSGPAASPSYPPVSSPKRSRGGVPDLLKRVWQEERTGRFQWGLLGGRTLGALLLLALARGARFAALRSAAWEEPFKYLSVVLLLVAAGALVWGLILAGKVVWQLRLKRLLFILLPLLVLLIVLSALTADTSLSLQEQLGQSAKQIVVALGRGLFAAGRSVVQTPGEFRRIYAHLDTPVPKSSLIPAQGQTPTPDAFGLTVEKRPLPSSTDEQVSEGAAQTATPSPGPEQAIAQTPTPAVLPAATTTPVPAPSPTLTPALQPPDCPHPQARITLPRVNQVIQDQVMVEGSADIENLGYYKFEFRRQDVEDEWHWTASFEQSVEEGELGLWQVSHLPEGPYILRLTVVNRQGNYPFPPCDVPVQIRH